MEKTMTLATAFTAIAVGMFMFWLLKRRRKLRFFKDLGIPGPEPDFIWGNLKQMDHRRIEACVQWRNKYGKVFGIYVGSEPFLIITDVQMAQECFVKQATIFQDRPVGFVDAEPFKSSIFQLGGNAWKYVRARLNYGFSSGTIKELYEKMNLCAARFVERISSISQTRGYVEVDDHSLDFSFDIAVNTVLAQQVKKSKGGCEDPILESLKQVIKDMENAAIEVAFTVPVLRALLTLIYPLTKHARAFRYVMNHVQNTLKLHRSGKLPREPSVLQAILDEQIGTHNGPQHKSKRRGKYLDDNYMSSNAAIFLLAGTETTSSVLSFLMYLLARSPGEQEKVVKEMDRVLSSEKADDLRFDQLRDLKRVDMVIHECLRLYPPVPLHLVRRCSRDTTVCGQFIPAGVNVIVTPWLIHRDPDYWPDPERFIPDRFAEECSESHRKEAYMPFGLGPRICIGQKLAFTAIKLALVKVLQKFQLTLRNEATGSPTLSVPSVILVPAGGVTIRLERRLGRTVA
ncbi:cytochrome P450 3A4 [Rhipicephalus sanguineus]|nr:cytochrome P450 3A4 [Rhipicephalus sanguineus]